MQVAPTFAVGAVVAVFGLVASVFAVLAFNLAKMSSVAILLADLTEKIVGLVLFLVLYTRLWWDRFRARLSFARDTRMLSLETVRAQITVNRPRGLFLLHYLSVVVYLTFIRHLLSLLQNSGTLITAQSRT